MDDELTRRVLRELRKLGSGPAPEPSPELRSLLDGTHRQQRNRWTSQRPVRSWRLLRRTFGALARKAATAAHVRASHRATPRAF